VQREHCYLLILAAIRRKFAMSPIENEAVGAPNGFFQAGFEHRYSGAVRSLISDLYVPVNQVRVVIIGESGCGGSGARSSQPYQVAT